MKKVLNFLLTLSFAWVIFNLVYVYLFLKGAKEYRIESSIFIFAFLAAVTFFTGLKENSFHSPILLRKSELIILALMAVLCWFAVYIPYLNLPFLSDDYVFLKSLEKNIHLYQAGGFFRPVFNIVFFLTIRVFGNSSLAFHVLNVLLHLAISCLVYIIAKKLLSSKSIAYITALFFLLSPIQPEDVVWISGLQELLWVFFLLCASYLYIKKREISVGRAISVSLLVILALLSKETAVIYILLFIGLDMAFFRLKRGKYYYFTLGSFVIILVSYLIIRIGVLSIPSDFLSSPSRHFIKSFFSQPFKIFLFPWNQAYYGGFPVIKFFISLIAVFLFWYYIIRGRISFRLALGCGAIFLGILPLYQMFYVSSDLQGSRYLYFSVFGWAAMLSVILSSIIKRKREYAAIVLVVIFLLTYTLHLNLVPWKKAGQIIKSLPAEMKKDDIPDNYFGAYILRNGYYEYTSIKQKKRTGHGGIFE